MPGILASIVATKRRELEALRPRAAELERDALARPPARDFAAALAAGPTVSLIAECKRRSPGAGEILAGMDPAALAETYRAGGARALSVLTDGDWFGGALADLGAASAAGLPILRKDFTLDPLQVVEARAAGADAVLLIVRILDDAALASLLSLVAALGLAALVEAHDEREVERALGAGARIVGINNRDLATFTTDLDTTLRLAERIPPDVLVVSESGIRTAEDVARLADGGADAILVGETLLRAADPALAASLLAGVPRGGRRGG